MNNKGRDVGSMRKDGLLSGTLASKYRYIFAIGTVAYTLAFGGFVYW